MLKKVALIANVCLGYRLAFRRDSKVFPYDIFPEPPIIDNGDNNGQILEEIIIQSTPPFFQVDCINVWVGNGACNRENNKPECNYDGGDCCRNTCIENCLKKSKTLEPCQFKCGTFNGYECIEQNAGCAQCSYHGTCISQDRCVQPIAEKGTILQEIGRLLYNCKSMDWTMGNLKTINLYCGSDPFYDVIHDENYKKLHFPGCGLSPDQCTSRPCCVDALRNDFNEDNCTNEVLSYTLYDPRVKTTKLIETSCISFFQECFIDNYKYYGQCCQCQRGWTGIDCMTPVCLPNCVNGTCIHPNLCLCNPGWQGDICNFGLCTNCTYGICIGPENCDCFYGYKGFSCDIPISIPPCLHGKAIEPNVCQCDPGWQSRICDVPVCTPDCGPNGHCILPNQCECDQGWYSSDALLPCDRLDVHFFDPNCIKSTNDNCIECDYQYFLDPVTFECKKCNEYYDQMCFECSEIQCLECQWPYNVDPVTRTCVSQGVFEFVSSNLDVSENEDVLQVYVRRTYGFNTTVTVDYDMRMEDKSYSRIEYRHDTMVFMDQDKELPIDLKVFKRPYFETDDKLTTFSVYLIYPTKGAEVGLLDTVTIRYFDDESLNDAQYSYPTLNGIRPSQQFIPDLVQNPGGKKETQLDLKTGDNFSIKVQSYYNQQELKTDGKCIFYLIQRDIRQNQLRDIITSTYDSENVHSLDFTLLDLQLKYLHVYSSTQGYSFQYFTNTEFKKPAYISRIEKHLPQVISMLEIKQFNHASLNITFAAQFDQIKEEEEVTFRLQVAEHSEVTIFLNGIQKVYTGLMDCNFKYVEGGVRRSYDRLISTRAYPLEVESCCLQTFEFRHQAKAKTPYLFEINYVQWDLPRNGPCIRMDRQSASMPLDSIDVEAIAITELTDSPFIVHPVLNVPFLDVTKSKFELIPHFNVNTRVNVTSTQFQCCVVNKYLITHRYEDLQIYQLSDLILILTLQTPKGAKSAESYFDQKLKKHFVELNYCDTLQVQSTLTLTLKGTQNQAKNSPMQVTMIPGPYDFASSSFREDIQNGCYLHLENCLARLDLKDKGYNLVMQPGVLQPDQADFVLTGPLQKPHKESVWFQGMFEAQVSPFNTQIVKKPQRSGAYELYARFNGRALNPYPLPFQVFSTVPDPSRTFIEDFKSKGHQICGKNMIFRVTLRDKSGDPLTSTSVLIKSRLESTQNQLIKVEAESIVEVATSVYEVSIVARVKGKYNLVVEVQKMTGSAEYLAIQGSPYSVYWESAQAFNTLTTVDGTGSQKVYTSGIETLNLQVRDEFGNSFNQTYWKASYVQNPVYIVQLIGDGTPLEVYETSQSPDIGLFRFQYVSKLYYSNLVLSVQIYTFKDSLYSYKHITGSPFPLAIIQQNEDYYCKQIDLLYVGYGFTDNTIIRQIPDQVAGVLFDTQIDPRNIFNTNYVETKDPVSDLFLLDFVPEGATCICNPSMSKYCKHFSGDYNACIANKQCKWTYADGQDAGGNLNNCVPCDDSDQCLDYPFGVLTSQAPVMTNDNSLYYLRNKINQKGRFKAHLNVWTQSGLQMLVFQKPDFHSLVKQQRAYNFTNLEFDKRLDEIFLSNEDWSVAFLGKVKYSATCDPLIPNRAPKPNASSVITVTYTIETNLQFEAYANGKIVAYHQAKQQTVNAQKSKNSFTIDLQHNQFFDFELQLQFDSLHNEQRVNQGQKYYLKIYVETFNTYKRVILPNELFMLSSVSKTLIPNVFVVPAAANAQNSNIDINQGNWAQNCIGPVTKRAPFQLTNVQVQVRDEFKNQKLLGPGENLGLKIYRGIQTSRIEEFGDWSKTTFYRQLSITQAQANLNYMYSTELKEAFHIYELKYEINGAFLPQTCRVNLINGPVDVTKSNAVLIQQDRYLGYDLCIFASELAYLVFELKDGQGNVIPLDDGAAYHDLFSFEFAQGSEFTNTDCKQYQELGLVDKKKIICKIRPKKADHQQLIGRDIQLKNFNGFPKSVQVLPSVHKRLLPGDLRIQRTPQSVTISFTTVDAYGNKINSLAAPCNYFTHERLIYFLKVIDIKGITQPSTQVVSYFQAQTELSFTINFVVQEAFLEMMVLDGLLLENGLSLKYYSEDNFLTKDQSKRPLYVENLQESLFASASKYWLVMHQKYDRFSMRASCLVKPKFTEVYFFLSSIQSGFSASRTTGFELWVGETLVIGEGKKQGQIQLQNNLWYAITIHYRVSNNIDPQTPQLLIQWQSTSQQVSTINAISGQVVALDIWETVQMKRAVVYNDIISL